MRKLNYLLLPLLVISFLASCGNNVNYIITSEWDDAITNKGKKYAQFIADPGSLKEFPEIKMQTSPTNYCIVTEDNDTSEVQEAYTMVKEDNSVYGVIYINGVKDKEGTSSFEEAVKGWIYRPADMIGIKDVLNSIVDFDDFTCSYNEFIYDKKDKMYHYIGEDKNVPSDLVFQFENKTFVSAKWNLNEEVPASIEYTYKKIIPIDPYALI